MVRLALAAVAALCLAEAPADHRIQALRRSPAPATQAHAWTVELPSGRTLSASITVGTIRVLGEARRDARIDVTNTAPDANTLSRVPIVLDQATSDVLLTALQPDDGKDPAYRTDVTLRVPRDAALREIRIAEGQLTLTSVRGSVTADVRRGAIEGNDIEGVVRLETEIGDIVLNRARLAAGGLLRLRTFNGDVRLTLAERPSDARILALALNGTIESAIPLHTKDAWGPRWGEASLGKGEPVISIDVVTGKISIATGK